MVERFEIAGTRIDLELPPGFAQTHWTNRYSRFAGASGEPAYVFRARAGELPSYGEFTNRAVRSGANGLVAEGGERLGELDLSSRRAELIADPRLQATEVLLRAAVMLEVLARGGCLFHASATVVDGRAYLFPGPSGAGKSTLAKLSAAPLSDDLCAVVPEGDGFVVHATPWWTGRTLSAPLAGVYTLSWDGEGLTELPRAAGLRHLASHMALVVDEVDTRAAGFAAAGRIAKATPFGRLAFTCQTDVDALLRRAA